jgi:hypothetical protein
MRRQLRRQNDPGLLADAIVLKMAQTMWIHEFVTLTGARGVRPPFLRAAPDAVREHWTEKAIAVCASLSPEDWDALHGAGLRQ